MKLPDVLTNIILDYYGRTYMSEKNIAKIKKPSKSFEMLMSHYASEIELFNDELYVICKCLYYRYGFVFKKVSIHVFDPITYKIKRVIDCEDYKSKIISHEPIPIFNYEYGDKHSKIGDKLFVLDKYHKIVKLNEEKFVISNINSNSIEMNICATIDEIFITIDKKVIVLDHNGKFLRE